MACTSLKKLLKIDRMLLAKVYCLFPLCRECAFHVFSSKKAEDQKPRAYEWRVGRERTSKKSHLTEYVDKVGNVLI